MDNIKDVIIIGGGISGLTALHWLKINKPEWDITLYDSDNRLGGTIGTDHINGYSFDHGPNGFLDREPLTLQLVDELGLQDKIERANERVTKRYILRKGKLREVPMSPQKFLVSDILSLKGRLRIGVEPFAKKRPERIDETIYDFVQRRIGTEAADYMIQPMVSGIYGGMADSLSLKACFPVMREMEDQYGSLIKAMIVKGKEAKQKRKESGGKKPEGGPGGPTGWLTSFHGGLFTIIEQFQKLYNEIIITGNGAILVSKDDKNYTIKFTDDSTVTSRHVIFALPTYKAADLTRKLSTPLAECFDSIQYAPISVVCMGYDAHDIGYDINGFGFLVPKKENRNILGSIWTSSIFSNRAPDGKVQLRTMIGGDGDHESINLSDEDLIALIKEDLHQILDIKKDPEQIKIYRWAKGIPQFKVGHLDRVGKLESELNKLGNLHITGNAYYGIGLNDCVKQSYKIVNQIIEQ